MSERLRLDKYLLDTGAMNSRSEAQAAIEAGLVQVNGEVVRKASHKVSSEDAITSEKLHPYVSRAALKLKGALEIFQIKIDGTKALDVGCSTGGFTEVLLEAGAAHVYAVDVGTDQFHERLRGHERITLFEQTDARRLTRDQVPEGVDLIVCDASFIGLEKVLDPAISFLKSDGNAILLFKPQFQVGRKAVGKGGIVTDQFAIDAAKEALSEWLEANGFVIKGWQPSSVKGSDGNQEWLVWAWKR